MTTNAKRDTAGTKGLKWGDKVAVPLGLGEIVGEVLEVYGPSPQHRYVEVRVPIHGPSGETLQEKDVSYPVRRVRLVAARDA